MNKPIIICEDSFQIAWAKVILALKAEKWKAWNIIVQIEHPAMFEKTNDKILECFAMDHSLLLPKHVAHTIFPQTFYRRDVSRERLYEKYWRFYRRTRDKPRNGWGTYFERMINYSMPSGVIDQLGNIIDNINNRQTNYGASFIIIIPYPHRDLNKIMGAPCLNNISVQVENISKFKNKKVINLLAVYRNHDFTERAYGNYSGLCNLIKYIANETNSIVGKLTCISSHAFIPNYKKELLNIANIILGAAP